MRIEFDPTNRDEATAVRAVLAALHPVDSNEWSQEKPIPVNMSEDIDPKDIGETGLSLNVLSDHPPTDSNGEPWDARIHSTPAKTNADGTWRAKRGVTADVVAQVKAEREMGAAGADPTDAERFDAEFNAPAPKAPTPPAPPTPAPSPTDAAPSFLDVMKAITAAQKAGKVDTAKVKELCAAIGAGDSTMGLNGADKGELRVAFMALLSAESGE